MEDEMEETEVEMLEFSLNDEEIDELMGKLNELRDSKQTFEFDIDDEHAISVSYDAEGNEGEDA
ncbi:hypothetical protein CO038_03380 [Candidatus Pacearchaeota archaeon CG_4_9_14_0_2_um_filter_39_13]|nr:hypothetical protein [Candidatus Pacearchaeota archaeon]OIO44036.1 MAG: hypothetical protein AUJ64_00780 [Candidatus Pacearchaeota archaeon CG1_02_39_14]PJC44502.1 MAG: hypothetical protein CO038_03380 [Candidatus Pacearchaeota archaeon CG_4_9_14_0_2_um_filter_39_13]QBM01497.1 hypothetical protein [uncultured archaeon]